MAKIKKKSALIGVFVLAAIAGIWRFVWQPFEPKESSSEDTKTEMVTSPTQPVLETPRAAEETSIQKKASVKTSYKNPGGSDEVAFSVTVDASGVITQASVEVLAKNPTSQKRQEAFAAGLPQAIQGKKLSDLTAIDKVGGSSLTTAAFNASLAELKSGI